MWARIRYYEDWISECSVLAKQGSTILDNDNQNFLPNILVRIIKIFLKLKRAALLLMHGNILQKSFKKGLTRIPGNAETINLCYDNWVAEAPSINKVFFR